MNKSLVWRAWGLTALLGLVGVLVGVSGEANSAVAVDAASKGVSTVVNPAGAVAGIPIAREGSGFHPVGPVRIVDSRTGLGGFAGPLGAGASMNFAIAGANGVTVTVTAAVLNVTVTGATAGSFLTLHPTGSAMPATSTVNFAPGQTVANSATVGIGASGQVTAFNRQGSVQVVVDLLGWYDDGSEPGDLFTGLSPARILDSRTATGGWSSPLAAGDSNVRELTVKGAGTTVPATASTVVINLTATAGTANSFLQVWPSGSTRPTTSNLNFGAGQTVAVLATVSVGAGGKLSFFNAAGSADVVADLVGYFDPLAGSSFHPISPTRVLDSRIALGAPGPWGPGQTRTVTVGATPAIPLGARAVAANLTVTAPTGDSFLRVFPTGGAVAQTSAINFAIAQTVANASMTAVGTAAGIDIINQMGTVDVILDVTGYFDHDHQVNLVADQGGTWYVAGSTSSFYVSATERDAAPADYDGNGRWEPASISAAGVWDTQGTAGAMLFPRPPATSTAQWSYILAVPGDYLGNGRAVPAWYRDSDATWFIQGLAPIQFGQGPTDPTAPADKINSFDQDFPVPADYDGDGITDLATYRVRTGQWKIRSSRTGFVSTFTLGDPRQFTIPAPADYDGVGRAQPAVFDNTNGWSIFGHTSPLTYGVGVAYWPAPADYLGTGRVQLSYLGLEMTPWYVQGITGSVTTRGPGSWYPMPIPFGINNFINVARTTLINRCVRDPIRYPC